MTNVITTNSSTNLPDVVAARRAAIQNVRSGLASSATHSPFLRLLKDGSWVAGRNDDEVETGTPAVFRIDSLQHGWVCWKTRAEGDRSAAELLGEDMVSWTEKVQAINDLPHYENGRWTRQVRVDVLILEGALASRTVSFKTNSRGGLNAIDSLLDAVATRMASAPDYNPVARLDVQSYRHASYGRIYVPSFPVIGWADSEGSVVEGGEDVAHLAFDASAGVEDTPAPARRRRRVTP